MGKYINQNVHQGGSMCLSTAYMNSGNERKKIMKDIARIEAEGRQKQPALHPKNEESKL